MTHFKKPELISIIIAVSEVIFFYYHFEKGAWYWLTLFMIVPLSFIFWSDLIGDFTGFIGRKYIDQPTPPILIYIFGWVLLFFPLLRIGLYLFS